MVWLSGLKRTLQRLGEPEVHRPERWPVTGLTAFYGLQTPSTPAPVRDISATGIYLIIREPLQVGQIVNLKLQREGKPESSAELELVLQARVVRQDEFGVGFFFVLPPGLDPAVWEVLARGIVVIADPDEVIGVFRALRTVLFVCRLCHSGAEEATRLLGGQELDHDRAAALFKMARSAENLIAADPDADRLRANPKLVATLLRDGSWAPDELTTQLWVGLFVSSCTVDEADDSNQILAEMLVHISPPQARILTHACERALSSAPESGDFTPPPVVLSPGEIQKLTGVTDLTRSSTDLAYLFNMGLIQNLFDFTSYRDFDSFDITPSRLGIELYRHCHGQRGKIAPELVAAAREHLTIFFPPPLPNVFENYTPFKADSPEEK